ncbi:portal protein [Arthrobacter phage Klevey]|uniref:Portal protein n=1 Tax=Arthrobacter phage Klevey TaxID=2867481 RepID=A0AAE8XJV2_9CAUD|nr:portal protein [Arthrobacter phage Klevey]
MSIETETGHPGGLAPDPADWFRPTGSSRWVIDPQDHNPDLRFPSSIKVYDEMRRTDGQIGSLLRAQTIPILKARWALSGDGVRPEVLEAVRREIGLREPGEARQRRRRHGVVLHEHLRDALLCLPLGFMPFEQVYTVAPATPEELASTGLPYIAHIRKLAPRMPSTVSQIHVGADGGLAGISQLGLDRDGWGKEIFIPVDKLVFYVLDREGADWSGVSVLRTAYKDYLIKDKLVRVNAMTIERNGMGVPVVGYDGQKVQQATADKLGRSFRAGSSAHVSLPEGATFKLQGVEGAVRDALPTIQHHNQEMSKSALAMFLDLGHDAGARSLGDTFVDFFTGSLQFVADSLAETFTEHVIRDFVELNFGPDEPYPVLSPGDLAANKEIQVESLKGLIEAGVIVPDEPLETRARADLGLPAADPATARKPEPAPAPASAPSAAPDAPAGTETPPAIPEAPVLPLSAGDDHLDRAEALLQSLLAARARREARGNVR